MKSLEWINRKEKSVKKTNNAKQYVPSKLWSLDNHEQEQASVDASMEAAIENISETAPQQGWSHASSNDDSWTDTDIENYTIEEIKQMEENILLTKVVDISIDEQGMEGVLPTIILPSKLKKLYEQEALLNKKNKS